MCRFGQLVKRLRKEKGLTQHDVAKEIRTQKGYISGIETGRVKPPSLKIIKRYALLFGLDTRQLARLAWVDKAPALLRDEAEEYLQWALAKLPAPPSDHHGNNGSKDARSSASEAVPHLVVTPDPGTVRDPGESAVPPSHPS